MHRPPDVRIANLLEGLSTQLDALFGQGGWEIADEDPELCVVRTSAFEIGFAYHWREQQVDASIRPLRVPPDVSLSQSAELWLQSRELRRESGPLNDRQVADELTLVRRVIQEIFADDQATRDAAFFAAGYNRAYNDWASRKGSWTESD